MATLTDEQSILNYFGNEAYNTMRQALLLAGRIYLKNLKLHAAQCSTVNDNYKSGKLVAANIFAEVNNQSPYK